MIAKVNVKPVALIILKEISNNFEYDIKIVIQIIM